LGAIEIFRAVKDIIGTARVVPIFEHPRVTHALPDLPGEAFYAWVCFFNDLFYIRTFLRRCWKNYHQSSDTLTTVALVTNTAIRMIRGNCDRLLRMTGHLPTMSTDGCITEWIFRGITGQFHPDHHFCHDSWQNFEASWCCYEAMFALQHHTEHLGTMLDEDYWRRQEKRFGAWPGDGERERYVGQYIRLLCLSLHNLKVFHEKGTEEDDPTFLPCNDKITNGWLRWEPYLDFKRIPLWLVVSFQILVDIREVLGRYSPTALDDLKENADDIESLFRKNMKHATAQARRETDPKYEWPGFKLPQMIKKCIRQDNFAKKEIDVLGGIERVPDGRIRQHRGRVPDFFLLKTNPLLCGMQSFWMEHMHLSFVSSTVKLHESIMPAALLYISMRQLGLVCMWNDMEFVVRTRGPEMLQYRPDYWELYDAVKKSTIFNSFNSYFLNADEPPDLRKYCLTSRYVSDLFKCYAAHETYIPQLGVPTETMSELINRVYPLEDWKKQIKNDVCRNGPPDVVSLLSAVTTACHLDEELASFDWFNMHDTCQEFFHSLRQILGQNYFNAFESEPPSPPSPTTGLTGLGDSSNSSSGYTPQTLSDDASSLDALYYLIFADDPDRRHENMILAALFISASRMTSCTIPNKEYMTERWADGIKRHSKELGISLRSAAPVLERLIVEDGDVNIVDSAVKLRKRQKLRTKMPEGSSDVSDDVEDERRFSDGDINIVDSAVKLRRRQRLRTKSIEGSSDVSDDAQDGRRFSDGDINIVDSATKLRKRQRLRTGTPEGSSNASNDAQDETMFSDCPGLYPRLYRNLTEAYKPEGAEENHQPNGSYQQNGHEEADSNESSDWSSIVYG
ncbi:hypothetical protein F5B21DRAFT_528935, partial [Xylaria acuta]